MKTFKFSLMLCTRENTDAFITLVENINGIHSKRANIFYTLMYTLDSIISNLYVRGHELKLLSVALYVKYVYLIVRNLFSAFNVIFFSYATSVWLQLLFFNKPLSVCLSVCL